MTRGRLVVACRPPSVLPKSASISSRTILTTCWAGDRLRSTSCPIARSRTRSTNALTTLKLTSASSRASRISRKAASTFSGVSRPSPRRDLKTSCRRVLRESNMLGVRLSLSSANSYRTQRGRRVSNARQLVPELFLLGFEIAAGGVGGRNLERQPLADRQTVALDAHQLSRVVAEKSHRADTELPEYLHADPVVALVGFEPEPLVGLHGIEPFVLELIRPNLVPQTDATPLLV